MRSAFVNDVRRRTTISALLFLLLLSLSCNNAPAPIVVNETKTPTGRRPPRTSLPMPPTTTASGSTVNAQSFTLLNDERMKLSDYLGKVVVVDFWATFCPPCLDEAPHLDALQKRFGNQGLLVIGLNVGGPDDRPKIPEFTERLNIKYTLGFPDPEMTNLLMGSDDRIPQTLVFDRKGQLLKHFVGYDQDIAPELERTIEKAVMSNE